MRNVAYLLGLLAGLAPAWPAAGARASVDVFPVANSRVSSPDTQISFRGASVSQLRRVTVSGSRSGRHSFAVKAHSDGKGASLLPRHAFRPGELVTVRTPGLRLTGAPSGVLRFRVARFARIRQAAFPDPGGDPKGPLHLHTDHRLRPPRLVVRTPFASPTGDKLFIAPKAGAGQEGPEIFDATGRVLWFRRVPKGLNALDFRTQEYRGRRVLTWWQGKVVSPGTGRGEGLIFDDAYRLVARVRAGNGYASDLHEFELTPAGTAYVTAYQPVRWKGGVVYDCVIQEIDVRTGLVEFEWHALDHVALADSYFPRRRGVASDYIHVNAVEPEPDGTLLISARNTSTVYELDRHSGRILWRLGGKHSDFKLGAGVSFAGQHDVRLNPDGTLTIFDNGSPPVTHRPARGIVIALDRAARTATLVRSFVHSPSFTSSSQGSVQRLPGGDYFVGWGGAHSWVSEYGPTGQVRFDAQISPSSDESYRAYRLPWTARPAKPPRVVASSSHGATAVWAAWNGATEVAAWRVLAGDSRASLAPVASAAWSDLETQIGFHGSPRLVRVQALNAAGQVIGTSAVVTPRRH